MPPKEITPSINEAQFFTKALHSELRLDGRGFDEYRKLQLEFGDEFGVADVRLGKTRVRTHVSCEIISPYPDRPFDGLFSITTELSPMCSPAFSSTTNPSSSDTSLFLSRLLEKTLLRSRALDTESLCLLAGQRVFSIRADVHVLSHDGNLVDAACVSVVAALAHFKRPDAEVFGEEVRVYGPREREGVALSLVSWPLCVTFSFYTSSDPNSSGADKESRHGEEITLLDPNLLEESLRDAWCTIGITKDGEICQIAKLGGAPIDAVSLLNCSNVALVKAKSMSALIKESLALDSKKRDKGGLIAKELQAENDRTS